MTLFESEHGEPRPPRTGVLARRSAVTWIILVPTLAAAGLLALTILPAGPPWDPAATRLSVEMEQVSDRIGLTDEGEAIFTDTRPELLDSADFREACGSTSESSEDGRWAVVGCYYGMGGESGRVAIFRPGDERLADQVVVTAAHEFLHAAYARLDPDERDRLDPLLEARWASVPADDPVQTSLASSVGTVSENRSTEQFAYLGTEIADAGDPALEAFYAPYFTDRQALVAIDGALDSLWTGLWADYQAQADALVGHEQANADAAAQAQADRAQLEAELTRHNDQVSEYNALRAEDQSRLVVVDADGTPGDEAWGDFLLRRTTEITAAESELAGRQAELDASVSAAQGERAAVEARGAELSALEAASVPASG
ncbi:hypothetical protein [Cryobacterium sp. PAMC25264]|uniref:hypothetical protein n=1 Tax=Cryobacterium sp. PAMC25264 TaxID=2861288 RepID=UPI001C62C2DA|nr:hypothetical protein [Cryobacterium sp. PAMC25264]QYF74160.1 hypothetical protein KY500_02670 [Cryobacterium sp. PAMC25264]